MMSFFCSFWRCQRFFVVECEISLFYCNELNRRWLRTISVFSVPGMFLACLGTFWEQYVFKSTNQVFVFAIKIILANNSCSKPLNYSWLAITTQHNFLTRRIKNLQEKDLFKRLTIIAVFCIAKYFDKINFFWPINLVWRVLCWSCTIKKDICSI